jgi:cytochrome bd ubiquinol oxidase subunit I
VFETQAGAPALIGGWPDTESGTVKFAIELPKALSLLAYHDADARVLGLKDIPREDWPNVPVTHLAFQVMVGCGTLLLGIMAWYALQEWRGGSFGRAFLRALVIASPLGFVALEAGWLVTEVGRQPWIVHGVMRTADAVTSSPHVAATFIAFSVLYSVLGTALIVLLRRLARNRVVQHG